MQVLVHKQPGGAAGSGIAGGGEGYGDGGDVGGGDGGGADGGMPSASVDAPANRKLRPLSDIRKRLGPWPFASYKSLFVLLSAVVPTSQRNINEKLARLRNRKVTDRSSCCGVRLSGSVGLPSSYDRLVRGQSVPHGTGLLLR